MRTGSVFSRLVLFALVVGFCLPRGALLAANPSASPTIYDVALQKDGLLVGQVIDANGTPQANVPVTIASNDRVLGTATTNEHGIFAFRGVKTGVYRVSSADGIAQYRVWQAEVAPPGAAKNAVVVATEDLTRGQCGGRLGMFLTRPVVLAGVIAAAIAIPLAIALSDDDEEVPPPATP